jgi:hypothetical protein
MALWISCGVLELEIPSFGDRFVSKSLGINKKKSGSEYYNI